MEIKKEKNEQVNNLLMNVRLNHTSPETKEIADIILSQIQEHMKKKQYNRCNTTWWACFI